MTEDIISRCSKHQQTCHQASDAHICVSGGMTLLCDAASASGANVKTEPALLHRDRKLNARRQTNTWTFLSGRSFGFLSWTRAALLSERRQNSQPKPHWYWWRFPFTFSSDVSAVSPVASYRVKFSQQHSALLGLTRPSLVSASSLLVRFRSGCFRASCRESWVQ